jgi:hypothetical protein
MNKSEDQLPVPSKTPMHSTTRKSNMKMTHGSAEVNIGQDSGVLHVQGAQPVGMSGPISFSGKGTARDLGPIFKAIRQSNPANKKD